MSSNKLNLKPKKIEKIRNSGSERSTWKIPTLESSCFTSNVFQLDKSSSKQSKD